MCGKCPKCGNEHIDMGFWFIGKAQDKQGVWECASCGYIGRSRDFGIK